MKIAELTGILNVLQNVSYQQSLVDKSKQS